MAHGRPPSASRLCRPDMVDGHGFYTEPHSGAVRYAHLVASSKRAPEAPPQVWHEAPYVGCPRQTLPPAAQDGSEHRPWQFPRSPAREHVTVGQCLARDPGTPGVAQLLGRLHPWRGRPVEAVQLHSPESGQAWLRASDGGLGVLELALLLDDQGAGLAHRLPGTVSGG